MNAKDKGEDRQPPPMPDFEFDDVMRCCWELSRSPAQPQKHESSKKSIDLDLFADFARAVVLRRIVGDIGWLS